MADRMRGPALAIAVAATVATAIGGCGSTASYVPTSAVTARAGLADVEIDRVTRGEGVTVNLADRLAESIGTAVRLRWHARADGTGITRAFLASPEARPCTTGVPAELMDADGQTRWDRPLGLGRDHVITLSFPEEPTLVGGALVVDVEVAGATGTECVRVPVAGNGQRYVAARNAVLLVSTTALVPVRSGSTPALRFELGPGRWFGPLRLTLGLGIGLGTRELRVGVGDSEESNGSSKPAFAMLHVAPELTFCPLVRRGYALGMSLGYEVAAGGSGAGTMTDPERDESYTAPRLRVTFARFVPRPLGAPAHRPLGGLGVELFALRPTSWPGDPGRGPAYVVGLGATIW